MATIFGTSADDTLNGTALDDTFQLVTGDNGLDQFNGNGGTDRILGTWSYNTIHVSNNLANLNGIAEIDGNSNWGYNTILGTAGNDTLNFSGMTVKNFIIDGGAGNDTITGTSGDDHIRGGAGNDSLYGGDGDDTFLLITGGTGDNNGVDFYDGGTGSNSIVGGWSYDVLRVTNNLANLQNIQLLDGGDSTLDRNTILGTSNHDTLDFSGLTVTNFTIDGAGGNDVITGTSGDDRIRGNIGNDTMDGGDGSDTYLVDRNHGADTFNDTGSSSDTDTILATNSNVDIGISALSGIEEISGNGKYNVNVVGTANHQTLDFSNVAFDGIGVVDALGGNDVIFTSSRTAQAYRGGAGSDTFHLGAKDTELRVSAADNGGFDNFDGNTPGATHTILAETAGTKIGIGLNYHNDVDVIDGNGKAGVSVVGSSGHHNVWDLSDTQLNGIDVVDTAGGNDVIFTSSRSGPAGGQAYRGGAGNDTFHLGSQDTRLLVSSADNGGFDSFDGNTTYALHRVIAQDGNTQIGIARVYSNDVDVIDGNGNANVAIVGSSGQHDIWDLSRTVLNDIVSVSTGGGNDTVQTALDTGGAHVTYDGGSYTHDKLIISLTAAQAADSTLINQIAALTPGSIVNGTLNAAGVNLTAENFENFQVQVDIGGSFHALNFLFGTPNHDNGNPYYAPALIAPTNDSWAIFGRGGDDILTGGAGDDFLNGEGGSDVMNGGDGNDTFGVSATDPANGYDTFNGGTGTDTIVSTDGADIQVLALSSIEAIDGNGFAGVRVVGTDSAHITLDLSNTTLTDIAEVYAGTADNVIWTSNLTADQAYRGGKGNDTFHLGSQDTLLLSSSADNGGFDKYLDNGAATHTILAEDDGTVIGLASGYGGTSSVDVIDAGGHAGVTILGSDSVHDQWDFSGTKLIGIESIESGAGNDTVHTAMDTGGAHVTYDGGSYTHDTLIISLTAAQAADATLIGQIQALTLGTGANGTLNAAGVNLSAENFENFQVQLDSGGTFQPMNFLFGTANHDNGNPYYAPALTAPTNAPWAIFGRGGDDILTGGNGADFLNGEGGNDVMNGGGGNDIFGVSTTDPANGYDWFNGGTGTDTIVSTDGSDIRVNALSSIEAIDGNGYAGVRVVGNDGAHLTLDLSNTALTDIAEVYAGTANNVIWTSNLTADQAYRGGKGNDVFHLGSADSLLLASSADNGGNDSYQDNGAATHTILAEDDGTVIGLAYGYGGTNSVDVIDGGGHSGVTIVGSDSAHNHWDFSDTTLTGIAGIYGGDVTANDVITGSAGNDNIFGLGGNDWLAGGEGNDTLTGGAGADVFIFAHDGTGNVDTITDYGDGADLIDLSVLLGNAGAANNATDVGNAVALSAQGGATLLSVNGQDVALLSGAHATVDVLYGATTWLGIA